MQAAAAAQGIDPSLAFLDPSLAAGPSSGPANAYTAKFNARTGAFARPDARDPSHLSEYERMKRMNDVFFDQTKWEEELEEEQESESKKRKKPTKKDLVGLTIKPPHPSFCPLRRVCNRRDLRSRNDRRRWQKLRGCVLKNV